MVESTIDIPALLATEGAPSTSGRYKFISTSRLVDRMQRQGWTPREAFYQKSRTKDPLYARHCIRFSRQARELSTDNPEIAVFNSHNGLSAAQILAGYFRLICSNGCVIMSEKFESFRIPHRGYKAGDKYVDHAIDQTTRNTDRANRLVEQWKETFVPPNYRNKYYEKALGIRHKNYEENQWKVFDYAQRQEDNRHDMWTVFNRVQEYLTRGGYNVTHTEGKKPRMAKELSSVTKLQDINEKLWALTENYVAENWA
jgi:hypothetical protein